MINCVYIHIPFCVKKCKYCSFCSFPLLTKKNDYLKALLAEIKYFYKGENLKTIYFGGGTPSLLEKKDILEILSCFNIATDCEITLELNPNDNLKIQDFYETKINRLSVGVQAFDDKTLFDIGRIHSSFDIYKTLELIQKTGFKNYSIDLMYGLPNQTLKTWENTLNEALKLDIKHISLYGLKIEQGSYFAKNRPQNLPDLDLQADMYELAIKKLSEKYIHYEFSNFALSEKYFSKHNLTYWNCEKYYGFGLSASGYLSLGRYSNTFNFAQYLKNPLEKKFISLSSKELLEEEIFLGFRKTDGINFDKINKKLGVDVFKKYEKLFEKFTSYGLMEYTQFGAKLTTRGILVSNEILCEFL